MNVDQINQIDALIQVEAGKRIKNHIVKRLTAPGENYGSLMLSVDITIEGPNGTEEINVVAKMVPPNEYIQQVFNTQVTFRNEIAFYKNIVPILQNFQKEHGVEEVADFAAKYLGSRLNLNYNDSKVDSDAALVLENLKSQDYTTLDRLEGLDLSAAELVLVNLAKFHAVSLAVKLQKPEVFEKEIKPHLSRWTVPEVQREHMREDIKSLIEAIEELKPLEERMMTGFDKFFEQGEAREPFATIVHDDCWTNNNMFKLDGTRAIKNKMVDYQICSYGSPARDVVFLIYSSVKNNIIRDHYEGLVKKYHQVFIQTLEELNCDTTPFSLEAFQKEIDFEAKSSQFGHLLFMLLPVYAPRGTVKEISEFTSDNLAFQEVTDLHREKYTFVVNEFVKKNWV